MTLLSEHVVAATATPGGSNYEAAAGQPTGPPAPPRDSRAEIGDLFECFDF